MRICCADHHKVKMFCLLFMFPKNYNDFGCFLSVLNSVIFLSFTKIGDRTLGGKKVTHRIQWWILHQHIYQFVLYQHLKHCPKNAFVILTKMFLHYPQLYIYFSLFYFILKIIPNIQKKSQKKIFCQRCNFSALRITSLLL